MSSVRMNWAHTLGENLLTLEVTPGFEPGNQGFADPCLTTWLCHHLEEKTLTSQQNKRPFSCWSGRRGSNSLPPPWQGGALPDELRPHMVPPIGIEPMTRGFSVPCSTNWATEANVATRNGLEPTTSSVTGWRSNQLNYLALFLVGTTGLEPMTPCL